MTFDVVVCTYNRPKEVVRLIGEIMDCERLPDKIIVVDSSEVDSAEIRHVDKVVYVKSSHKNQPYQRLLGSSVSDSEIVTFFDDDLKITDKKIFNYLIDAFNEEIVVGSCVKLIYEETDKETANKNKDSVILNNVLSVIKRVAIGKKLKPGEMWLLGMDTPKNEESPYVEYVGGGDAPTFRRDILKYLFDDFLFSLYERGIGKGEDKYFTMQALKYGRIRYTNKVCLAHPPLGNSFYFENIIKYRKNSMRTRLLLSLRYAELKDIFKPFVHLHYTWFAFWTFIKDVILLMFKPAKQNYQTLLGNIAGYFSAIVFLVQKKGNLGNDINWNNEIEKDIQKTVIVK